MAATSSGFRACDDSATFSRSLQHPDRTSEGSESLSGVRSTVVASELGVESLLLLVHRCMSVLLAPCGDGREAPAEPFTHRSHMHGELPSPAACANVRQTEKVEGAGSLLALLLRTLLGVTPKFQQPRCA
jgi:hypothetical protein